jgi:NADPH-ferrihemoprotein reductase
MKATNSIVHVEFDVSPSRFPTGFCELKYDTGDNICIIPVNSDSVVEAVSSHLDTHLDAIITITPIDSLELFQAPFPTPCSLREYLSFYCELGTPPPRSVIRTLSRFASIPREKEELRRLSASKSLVEYTNRIVKENIGIADLLTQYFPSVQIPLVNFIRICSPLRARWYSISSSALVDPYSLSITCSVLSIPRKIDDSIFNGICSHYLAHLKPNDTCRIIKMGSSGFVPPRDPLAPLIMICNGTGIAPFRAILLELYHKKVVLKESLGKVMLFYGVRSKLSGGVLFLDELNTFLDDEVLSDLYLACSRDQPQKIYVQHLIAQHAEMIWRLLYSGGCHLYVCGASEMIKDVDDVLRITAARFMEKKEIENFMEYIENEHRYVREGWTKKLDISLPFS